MAGKKPQRGLGRGLGALLGEDVVSPAEEKAADEVLSLEIRLIDPNREQPRRDFDEEALLPGLALFAGLVNLAS